MSRYPLVISPAAREDLIEIHRFGRLTWGDLRSGEYLQRLKERFWSLTELPHIGIARSDLLPGIRSAPVSSHVIFYRFEDGCVEVVRVLHRRQDAQRHLL
ncbi:type II toxin-antitoxin system RelE/ParE family toxin [Thiorhodovibrio frisius]|uniref:type II toxin-antitoxin system RelE/ParE family toxin n=1 Tax=Thiorhodovibrio frisius TaxID=631362 RepID=UPI000255E4C4